MPAQCPAGPNLLAKKLELGTGISAQFWLSRQQKYDLHKAATLNVVAEPLYQYD
jgi:plasmid maintenance system antidote protein VapI